MSENRQTFQKSSVIAKVMTDLSTVDFKKIIQRRDPKYDGRFYFGVKTTKIYCRPVCPAKPKPENIVIFKSCTEAENQGFRPCLRCHPDTMPGIKWQGGTIQSVARALHLMETSLDWDQSLPQLANRLGLSDRHLRRLFDEHLGASPIEILTTKRLHLARQLVKDTQKSFSEIAFAVGFQSVRRFNEAFKTRYRSTPSEHRKKGIHRSTADQLTIHLPVRAPLDWTSLLAYLKRHEVYGIESISEKQYTRFLSQSSFFTATFNQKQHCLEINLSGVQLRDLRKVLGKIQILFDLNHTPSHLPGKYSADGIRAPGCFDPFETAISIVLSQLISTEAAKNKLKQLILEFGQCSGNVHGMDIYHFPTPDVLASASIEKIGTTKVRANAIRELSKLISEKRIDLSQHTSFQETRTQLTNIKGIGPWTAEMISMRCLGDSDAFPRNDLVIAKALASKQFSEQDWISQRSYLTHLIWRNTTNFKETANDL